MKESRHDLTLDQDQEGWDFAACDCGWTSPPCPETEIAAQFWGEHKQEIGAQIGIDVMKARGLK